MLAFSVNSFSAADLCVKIGESVAEDIKNKKLRKQDVAKKAGITPMSLYRLCNGENSSLETLLKVLKAIGRNDVIEAMITPEPPAPLSYLSKFKGKRKTAAGKGSVSKKDIEKLIEGESEWNV